MTFKRLNQDTICCILTEDDMLEYGVELEDFILNKEKAQDVLHNIVERAAEELALDMHKGGMLSLQIMPLPDNSISIMFSEKGQINVMEMVNQLKKALGNIEELKKLQQNTDMPVFPDGTKTSQGSSLNEKDGMQGKTWNKDTKPAKKEKNGKQEKKGQEEESRLRIYSFASIMDVAEFCSYVPTKTKVVSQLYKDSKQDIYYLVFTKSKLSKKDFAKVCSKAVEFGKYISDDPVRAAYLEEHMEHIVEEKAVRQLRKFSLCTSSDKKE